MAKNDGKCAAKIAQKKAKIAVKCGKKAAKTCAVLALLAVVAGCMDTNPASRQTQGKYGDIKVCVYIDQREATSNVVNVTVPVTLGDAAIASADSAGSTETQTLTPTQKTDVSPKTDVNTTGGRTAGVLESIVGAFGTWLSTPSGKEAAAKCEGGNCATGTCTDGSCSTGTCTDGSCNP